MRCLLLVEQRMRVKYNNKVIAVVVVVVVVVFCETILNYETFRIAVIVHFFLLDDDGLSLVGMFKSTGRWLWFVVVAMKHFWSMRSTHEAT